MEHEVNGIVTNILQIQNLGKANRTILEGGSSNFLGTLLLHMNTLNDLLLWRSKEEVVGEGNVSIYQPFPNMLQRYY